MKRLWFSLALLAAVCTATMVNSFYLSRFTLELTDLLTQAETQGKGGNWQAADELTRQAQQRWESHRMYLHTTLRHADIDNVHLYFLQSKAFLEQEKLGEYSAANAALIGHLTLLREQEEFTLENIL